MKTKRTTWQEWERRVEAWRSSGESAARRRARSKPILDEFAAWRTRTLDLLDVDPRGPLRKALNYSVNHWDALSRFLEDGHIPISNNLTEIQIRHIAVGRHNWLFFGSEPDALVACTWLSLVASAKLHALNPEDYLRDLFRVLSSWPSTRPRACPEVLDDDARATRHHRARAAARARHDSYARERWHRGRGITRSS